MKYLTFLIGLLFHSTVPLKAQTVIKMEKIGEIYKIPCEVNGLPLKFILDTGASDVSISLTEALFMLRNGYLSESDIRGTEYYRIANGKIAEGTEIILREIKIGNLKLYNIEAGIVHEVSAPLLLGQSALNKLGKIEIDYSSNTLTIKNEKSDYGYTEANKSTSKYSTNLSSNKHPDSYYSGYYKYKTTFDKPPFEVPLRDKPSIDGRELYKCPKNATVYVIDNTGKDYFIVFVNGYIGYLRNTFLKSKW